MRSVPRSGQPSPFIGVGNEIALLDGLFTAKLLLGPAEARRAYALVALAHPQVTARQWDAFARRCTRAARGRRGLVTIQDQRRYVHAVFRYAVDVSPLISDGRTLRLHDVVMAQLPGHALVPALAACAERLAAGLGCTAAALDVPAANTATATAAGTGQDGAGGSHVTIVLQAVGFWMAAATMVRNFGNASA